MIKMIRLNKYFSEVGYCSRRQGDKLIEAGRVTVNGSIATLGDKINEEDVVKVDGKVVERIQRYEYILLNKPVGITSTTDLSDPTNMIEFVNYPHRIFPVGRLDKDSEGLILLTSDGDIVNKVLRSGNEHDKEYRVTVDKVITKTFLQSMRSGVHILNTVTKPAKVRQNNKHQFTIILHEGLNRQIRRMCSKLGYHVTRLVRTRIMHLTDQNLKQGHWRHLTKDEIEILRNKVKYSSKTQEVSK